MQAPVTELLLEAAGLLLIGMLVVFAFLSITIGAIQLIAIFCQKFPGTEEQDTQAPAKPTAMSNSNRISSDTVAAISAAVHQYRNTQ